MSAEPLPLLKPPALASGASVSIIAPASYAKPERVERGLDALRRLGFAPHLGENAQGLEAALKSIRLGKGGGGDDANT